ncbi:MAG: hypothetical protein GY864_06555 [Desulfobacterales bacterium]|nr:hypothetical protein [Desulfobacterales bacterium]
MTGRIERLQNNFQIKIQWVSFPLRPNTPEQGITVEELFSDRGVDVAEVQARLELAAKEEGLPFGVRKKTYNSRLTHELGKWAETKGKGTQFHDAAFRAFFVDGRNIGKTDELVGLAKSVGLSQKDAREILDTRAFKVPVDKDWARSEEMKIKVVPTLLINKRHLRGAQSYNKMEQFLMDNGVKRVKDFSDLVFPYNGDG